MISIALMQLTDLSDCSLWLDRLVWRSIYQGLDQTESLQDTRKNDAAADFAISLHSSKVKVINNELLSPCKKTYLVVQPRQGYLLLSFSASFMQVSSSSMNVHVLCVYVCVFNGSSVTFRPIFAHGTWSFSPVQDIHLTF